MVKIYKQPFAHDGDAIEIPGASQPDGKMSSADGWTPDYQLPRTDPNYKPVGRQEMNGVFKEVTEAVGELQQFGFAKWQPMQWPQGARVVEGGVVYRAINQTSQQPPHADWMDESAIAVGQTWQDVTNDRNPGVVYTNATGRAIMVVFSGSGSDYCALSVGGVEVFINDFQTETGAYSLCAIVPAGSEYSVTEGAPKIVWTELR